MAYTTTRNAIALPLIDKNEIHMIDSFLPSRESEHQNVSKMEWKTKNCAVRRQNLST